MENGEIPSKLNLVKPSAWKRVLEDLGWREITPSDITLSSQDQDNLFKKYPAIAGDKTSIGHSDAAGDCQDWKDDPGWWKELLKKEA